MVALIVGLAGASRAAIAAIRLARAA